ncbi:zinc finger protein 385A-like [Colius striatus]|uniref:zinc finger protein 385A-like n=1 Tax=Colius striatus TaxID=57412 RepID=UPI002B1D9D30|nr:zinc finger protein 385A-like [Colius striatus]
MEPLPKGGLGGALAKPRRPVIACSVCQIRFNSQSQAAAHYQGNRHARRLKGLEAARGGQEEEEEEEKAKAKRLLYCALCKVAVNSLSQLEAHNKGTKHRAVLEPRVDAAG